MLSPHLLLRELPAQNTGASVIRLTERKLDASSVAFCRATTLVFNLLNLMEESAGWTGKKLEADSEEAAPR